VECGRATVRARTGGDVPVERTCRVVLDGHNMPRARFTILFSSHFSMISEFSLNSVYSRVVCVFKLEKRFSLVSVIYHREMKISL
jgi:hypothetical protein